MFQNSILHFLDPLSTAITRIIVYQELDNPTGVVVAGCNVVHVQNLCFKRIFPRVEEKSEVLDVTGRLRSLSNGEGDTILTAT